MRLAELSATDVAEVAGPEVLEEAADVAVEEAELAVSVVEPDGVGEIVWVAWAVACVLAAPVVDAVESPPSSPLLPSSLHT